MRLRLVFHATSLIITLSTLLMFLYQLQKRKYLLNKPGFFISLFLALTYLTGLILHQKVNNYLFFLMFSVSAYFVIDWTNIERKQFLQVINATYLFYLLLSLLVYVGVIPPGEKFNQFQYSVLGINVKTFIGLFGSTSSIDSYSMVVLLLNFFFAKKNKYLMIGITFLAGIMTFRFTPLLILIVPILARPFFKASKRGWTLAVLVPIFLSFTLPLLIDMIIGSKVVNIVLNVGLNGRAFLWMDILASLEDKSLMHKLFGFGDTSEFVMQTWNHETDNPHSVFLGIMLNYGFVIYCTLFLLIFNKMRTKELKVKLLILACLVGGVGNSVIFSFINVPIVLIFVYALTQSNMWMRQSELANKVNKEA